MVSMIIFDRFLFAFTIGSHIILFSTSIGLTIIIFSLQFLIYPSVIGQTLSIDSVTTTGPVASEFVVISAVGGALTAIMAAFYLFIVNRQSSLTKQVTGAKR